MCSRLLFKKKCLLWHFSAKCIWFLKQKRRTGVFASRHNNRPTLHAELSSHNFKPLIFTASFWCLSIEITPSFIIRKLKALSRSLGRVNLQACSSFLSFRVSLHKISQRILWSWFGFRDGERIEPCHREEFNSDSRLYVSVKPLQFAFVLPLSLYLPIPPRP